MGYGGYSFEAHRAITSARADLPTQAVFKQRECHPLMRPHGLRVRESRDSESHPHSLGIILALDVTGSMGEIPELLAKKELPGFVKLLLDHGVPDPQVLFMAVGARRVVPGLPQALAQVLRPPDGALGDRHEAGGDRARVLRGREPDGRRTEVLRPERNLRPVLPDARLGGVLQEPYCCFVPRPLRALA